MCVLLDPSQMVWTQDLLISIPDIKTSETDICWEEWDGDVLSRLFWTSLMLESIGVQELNLPSSGLGEFESIVPIPKFRPYPHRHNPYKTQLQPDDTFFQFHFLAQVAHRIMLTRIRNTLYFYCKCLCLGPRNYSI